MVSVLFLLFCKTYYISNCISSLVSAAALSLLLYCLAPMHEYCFEERIARQLPHLVLP